MIIELGIKSIVVSFGQANQKSGALSLMAKDQKYWQKESPTKPKVEEEHSQKQKQFSNLEWLEFNRSEDKWWKHFLTFIIIASLLNFA